MTLGAREMHTNGRMRELLSPSRTCGREVGGGLWSWRLSPLLGEGVAPHPLGNIQVIHHHHPQSLWNERIT